MWSHRCCLNMNAANTKWSIWASLRTSGYDELVSLTDRPTHGSFRGDHPTLFLVSISKRYIIICLPSVEIVFLIDALHNVALAYSLSSCIVTQCSNDSLCETVSSLVATDIWNYRLINQIVKILRNMWKLSSFGVSYSSSVMITEGFYVTMTCSPCSFWSLFQ